VIDLTYCVIGGVDLLYLMQTPTLSLSPNPLQYQKNDRPEYFTTTDEKGCFIKKLCVGECIAIFGGGLYVYPRYYAIIAFIVLDGGIRSNCCSDHFQLRLFPLHPNLLPTNSTSPRLESVTSQLLLTLTMESPHVSSPRLFV
jgi:hypothetical protein